MTDRRKIAAIAGALSCLTEAATKPAVAVAPAPAGPSPWALYGRQNQMSLRNMMQRRTARGTRQP